jgi:hypothetical protein
MAWRTARGVYVLRRLDRCAKLGHGVLRHVERIVARPDAATRHQLDLRRAHRELLAHPLAHGFGIVGDRGGADALAEMEVARRRREFRGQPEVAVAAALRDHRA